MVEALSFVKDRLPTIFNGLVPVIAPLTTALVKQKLGLPTGP